MTDKEFICQFMETKPDPNTHGGTCRSPKGWWFWYGKWETTKLTLDALWEVEERLTDEQWQEYDAELGGSTTSVLSPNFGMIHATAEQKIKALASVLREGSPYFNHGSSVCASGEVWGPRGEVDCNGSHGRAGGEVRPNA